ncbi:hypothetical protein [Tellurirhabdus bombi]|uniref:hypothetical protein n=1 Tax=Tellurirhabdus bombi TaxID=2907205 RepID=UPI001F38C82A|nr:hypothetical protein [Tellurirhabdus bombi]
MDPNVFFSDTSARRAELMEATEEYKSRIETNVNSLKGEATEVGKTVALVAGVCVAVYLVANLILPDSKSDEEEDEEAYYDEDADKYYPKHSQKAQVHRATKAAEDAPKKSAIGGAIMGILTSVATNFARQQAMNYLSRLTHNNAAKQQPASVQPTQPASY